MGGARVFARDTHHAFAHDRNDGYRHSPQGGLWLHPSYVFFASSAKRPTIALSGSVSASITVKWLVPAIAS